LIQGSCLIFSSNHKKTGLYGRFFYLQTVFGLLQRLDEVNVILHGLVIARALKAFPCIVFCTTNNVCESWAFAGVVAFRGLFEEGVNFQQGLVVRAGGQLF
jgi:hypothetical protein